jgi:hypothetical protein
MVVGSLVKTARFFNGHRNQEMPVSLLPSETGRIPRGSFGKPSNRSCSGIGRTRYRKTDFYHAGNRGIAGSTVGR